MYLYCARSCLKKERGGGGVKILYPISTTLIKLFYLSVMSSAIVRIFLDNIKVPAVAYPLKIITIWVKVINNKKIKIFFT